MIEIAPGYLKSHEDQQTFGRATENIQEKTQSLKFIIENDIPEDKLKVTFRFSARGVPHLVVQGSRDVYSICWMGRGRGKTWRIFTRYGGMPNPKTFDRKTSEEIVHLLQHMERIDHELP